MERYIICSFRKVLQQALNPWNSESAVLRTKDTIPILGIVCLNSFFNYFLSKKREVVPDLAPMLWHSFGKQLSLNQVFLRKTFCMPSFKCLLDVKYTDKPNQMLLQCKEVLWLKQTPDETLWCLYKGPWIWLIKQLYWTCYGHSCYF